MINAAATNSAATENVAAAANAADPAANAANAANAAAAAAQAAWQEPFCSRYAHLLFDFGHWFLLVALIVGTLGALAAVVKLFMPGEEGEAGGNVLSSSVAALAALIDSLAKAPTWIAMLGAALALFWMSGHALPTYCKGSVDPAGLSEDAGEKDSSSSNRSAADDSAADDESGG